MYLIVRVLAFQNQDEDHLYQREMLKKNVVLTRMQEYELKKIEGLKL